MASVFHVATTGSDSADGSPDRPLRTINRAAELAQAGDTVVVHEGVYREWVRPRRGGLSDQRRITYEAAAGRARRHQGLGTGDGMGAGRRAAVWKVSVPNSLFGSFNPFAEEIDGDWIVYPEKDSPKKHLGDVYLNGHELLRGADPGGGVGSAAAHRGARRLDRAARPGPEPGADAATCGTPRSGDDATTIWANFQGADPNAELVEINVRRSVFYPTEHHLDYITVRGFELAQAACPWTPPTADQPGLIGPNWAKGWIIEDNVIHDAKCSAISIGKEASTGHNYATTRGDKPGYQYQLESVFAARQIGWDKEHIGSHVIRRNTIYDCGQNGIVGHLGCVFSTIEDNHIYNIALKREFYGYEIGGIKLHAAIDVVIRHNRIHDCSLGTWLDWQTQGTRISRNVFYANNRDLFVEVSHGPYLVEHNIFASAGVPRVVQPGRRVREQPGLRHAAARARHGPRHAVPRPAQHPGRRLRGDLRRRRPLHRQRLPRRRRRPRLRPGVDVPQHAPGTARPATTATRPSFAEYLARIDEQPPGDHQRFPGRQAARLHPRQRLRRRRTRLRRRAGRRSSSTAQVVRRRRRRRRRGLPADAAAARTSTAPASASSPGRTWSVCASSTPTSRSATAAPS